MVFVPQITPVHFLTPNFPQFHSTDTIKLPQSFIDIKRLLMISNYYNRVSRFFQMLNWRAKYCFHIQPETSKWPTTRPQAGKRETWAPHLWIRVFDLYSPCSITQPYYTFFQIFSATSLFFLSKYYPKLTYTVETTLPCIYGEDVLISLKMIFSWIFPLYSFTSFLFFYYKIF